MIHENSRYESDIRYTVQIARSVLSLVGVWPIAKDSSILRSLPATLMKILCQFLFHFILISGILHTFLKETKPGLRLKHIGPVCTCLMAILKLSLLLHRENQLRDCLRYIEDDWRNAVMSVDRKTMMENARIGHRLGILCVIFIYCSGFSFRIVSLSRGTIVTPENVTIRPLPLSGYFVFFDPQKSPAYEIVCAMQLMAAFLQYTVTSGIYSLAALFVVHACGQLSILATRIRNLTEGTEVEIENTNRKLAVVIQRHVRVKSFLREVEDILQQMCLVDVIGTTLVLCLVGYCVIMEWENSNSAIMITYCTLLLTFLFNIFIICFIGELLTEQGSKVFVTSCTMDWYRLPDRTARCLVLMIATSSFPVKITAGKLMDLSLNGFITVVKTAVAYLNILRTVIKS